MKKVLFIVIALVSINLNAQIEKNAKKITDEMTEVMDLSKEQSDQVYQFNLKRLKKMRSIRKENEGLSKEEIKIIMQPVQKEFAMELRELVGREKMKNWAEYRKKEKEKNN